MTVRQVLGKLVTVRTAIVLMCLSAVLSSFSAIASYHAEQGVEAEQTARQDQQCVSSWETREDIRDAVERAARAGAEAIIAIADAKPETVKAYRAAVAAQVAAARAEIPNPSCDLAAAKRRLK